MSVARDAVVAAYLAFLGRKPESDAVVESYLHLTHEELLQIFLTSNEYRRRAGLFARSLDWPPMHVDIHANPTELAAMIAHVERTWHNLGTTEPHWSVLSQPEYRADLISDTKSQFLETGRHEAQRMLNYALRAKVDFHRGSCLELGCGLGRVTAWLAGIFESVRAVDVSASHLRGLETTLQDQSIRNVQPTLITQLAELKSYSGYDAFFSVIVLQHNPPPVMADLLRSALEGLSSGGIAYFQVPTYSLGYEFSVVNYLGNMNNKREIEMHVLPQPTVFAILDECNCNILEIREDAYTGEVDGVSNTFFAQKR